MADIPNPSNPGLGIDAAGDLSKDPTENVYRLVEAEKRRQDDLRIYAERLSNVKLGYLEKIINIHAAYEEKLRVGEAARLDAIRAVDVQAASLREERATAQALALANQLTVTAETLRTTVATTASAAEAAAAAVTGPLSDRIAVLEKGSYEGTGKAAVQDPLMAKMVETLEGLSKNMAQGHGAQENRTESRLNTGMGVSIAVAVFGFLMLVVAVLVAFK